MSVQGNGNITFLKKKLPFIVDISITMQRKINQLLSKEMKYQWLKNHIGGSSPHKSPEALLTFKKKLQKSSFAYCVVEIIIIINPL